MTQLTIVDGPRGFGHGPTAFLRVQWHPDGQIVNGTRERAFTVTPTGAPSDGAAERAAELADRLNRLHFPLSREVGQCLPHLTGGLLKALLS